MTTIKHKRIELPDLPYNYDALEPVISKEIMTLHHTRHHLSYVTGANAAMDKLEKMREGLGLELDYKATLRDLSFHLSGHKLHSIFWTNMKKPEKKNLPSGAILEKIEEQFGSFEAWKAEFTAIGLMRGIGWTLLVHDAKTNVFHNVWVSDHEVGHLGGLPVMLAMDVWEHAYLLDYLPAERGKYIAAFFDNLRWDVCESRFTAARTEKRG